MPCAPCRLNTYQIAPHGWWRRSWQQLSPAQRVRLVDVLVGSTNSLAHSADMMLRDSAEGNDTVSSEAVLQHQNGAKMLGFLMSALTTLAAEEAAAAKAEQGGARAKPAGMGLQKVQPPPLVRRNACGVQVGSSASAFAYEGAPART